MKRISVLVAIVATTILALTAVGPAVAYIEQQDAQILLGAPNVVKCNQSATITAKVRRADNGKPVVGQTVRWSLARSQSSGDRLSTASSVTNARGRARVTLSFGPVAGPRVVRAATFAGSPSVTIRCAGGLPKTSPVRPVDYVEQPSALVLAPPAIPESTSPSEPPATTIRLRRLGIDLPLVEGDGVSVPESAAVHYPGTAWPGEGSNAYVYAHAREGHFLELWGVRTGDRVEVDMADGGLVVYEVSEIHPVVPWDALEYLAPTEDEILTLQTCLTYDDTAPRFVVIAERIPGA